MVSPVPPCFAAEGGQRPPIITVGSRWARKIWVHMEVVVVFPWVPATQGVLIAAHDGPRPPRSKQGSPAAWAAAISGYRRGRRRCG